jgi:hypothetical protein
VKLPNADVDEHYVAAGIWATAIAALASMPMAHGSQLCDQQGAFFRLLQQIVESPRGLFDRNCIRRSLF